jgi:hypothetical protein
LSIDNPENVAIPEETVVAEPPFKLPPPGFVPIASVIVVALSVVSTLPLASSTATVTAAEIAEPACALEGPWMKASCVADPGLMLNADEVAGVYVGVLEAVRV